MPISETMLPGAIEAASPPPASTLPLAAATSCAVVALLAAETLTYKVVVLPFAPDCLEVSSTSPVARSGVA